MQGGEQAKRYFRDVLSELESGISRFSTSKGEDSAKSIKSMIDALQGLGKMGSGIGNLGSSFGSSGEAFRKAFGETQLWHIQNLKKAMGDMSAEAINLAGKIKEIDRLGSETTNADRFLKAGLTTELGQNILSRKTAQAQIDAAGGGATPPPPPGGGGGFSPAILGGSGNLQSIMSGFLVNWLGSMATSTVLMPQMTAIARQTFEMSASKEALAGDPTRLFMRQHGIGNLENAGFGSQVLLGMGEEVRWIRSILSGNIKSDAQLRTETRQMYEESFKGQLAPLLQPAYEFATNRIQNFGGVFRSYGNDVTMGAMNRLNQGGLPDEAMQVGLNAFARANVSPDRIGGIPGAQGILTAARYMGMSPEAVQQLALSAGATGRGADVEGLLGGMGMFGRNTFFARGAVSQEMARLSGQQTGGDLSGTYAPLQGFVAQGMLSQATSGAFTPEQAAGAAVKLEQAGKAMAGGKFFSTGIEMALFSLGVKPGLEMARLQSLLNTNPSAAISQIAKQTGKSESEIKAKIGGFVGTLASGMEKAFGITTPEQKAFAMTGNAADFATIEMMKGHGIGDVIAAAEGTRSFRDLTQADAQKVMAAQGGAKGVQQVTTPQEEADKERAAYQSELGKVVQDLSGPVRNIIASSFSELAKLLIEQHQTASGMAKDAKHPHMPSPPMPPVLKALEKLFNP